MNLFLCANFMLFRLVWKKYLSLQIDQICKNSSCFLELKPKTKFEEKKKKIKSIISHKHN